MTKHLRTDLERLERKLLALGALAEEAVRKAITAVVDRKGEVAEEVIRGDREIDLQEIDIEEDCLKVLALHQPVANDLRFVTAVLKINNDLERVGDLAVNIAERAASLALRPPMRVPSELRATMERTTRMLRQSLDAFVAEDSAKAQGVLAQDDEVDRSHRALIQDAVESMQASPETIDRALQLVSISRNLERIADHATNIAEDAIYLVGGEIVRHGAHPRRPAKLETGPEGTRAPAPDPGAGPPRPGGARRAGGS